MDYLSGFYHRVVGFGHVVANLQKQLPPIPGPGKINEIAQATIHGCVRAGKGVKYLYNLGPVQITRNATKTFWATAQIVRKPELVLQQLPNAANIIRYGTMTCSFYKEVGGQFIPFDLFAPESLHLLANGTELAVMCAAPQKITKRLALEFISKLAQIIQSGVRPMIDQTTADEAPFRSLELATATLGLASTVITLYVCRNEIKDAALKAAEICNTINNAFDTLDQDMADADMTLDEMKKADFFKPSQQEEPKTQPASPMKVEEEEEPVKKEAKRRGISNPTQELSKKEQAEIDRTVRQLEDFWFFDNLPLPPKK